MSADEDPIAEAIVSGDAETRVRYARWALLGRYSHGAKLRAVAAVAGTVAGGVVGLAALRGAALRAALGTAPLGASVTASLVLAAGLKFLTLGGGGLVLVGVLRRRGAGDPERLLAVEETASILGLGTGGLGVLVGMALLALLAATGRAAAGLSASAAEPVPLPVTYGVLAGWAAGLAAACLAASAAVDG